MKLSTKLKISFAILIIVPVLLFSVALILVASFKLKEIRSSYNADGTSYETLINPAALVFNICESEYRKLADAADNEPYLFSDYDFMEGINTELKKRSAFLVVVKNSECVYSGDERSDEILEQISRIDYNGDSDRAAIYLEQEQAIVNIIDYGDPGNNGYAYVVMCIDELVPQMKMLIFDGIVGIVLILIFTSGIFTTWIYKETVSPINKLKLATYNIKNGNLDFKMDVEGKDEIAELCRDFDSMRKRLLENAEDKIKIDNENKELIRNISHDLKTPLTAIKGYVEGIMDGVVDTPEKMDRYVKTIYNKVCDMDKLIDELTFYSKIDTDRVPYNFVCINLTDYFEDCVEEIGTELDAEGVRLSYSNEISRKTTIIADPEQLKRVINNIVSNSVKYRDKEQSAIDIRLTENRDNVFIDIEDNGKGIEPKDLPHIFDRFYRADASRNTAAGGSGIGLSIVSKIIKDHGGTISAESTPGVGTIMHITMIKHKQVKPVPKRIDKE